MMRVRDEEGEIYLAYKGARTKRDGEWEEYELSVDDKLSVIEMLKSMGLEKIIEVHKKRKEYKIKDLSICLDNIKGLGNFIEIECLCNNTSMGKKKIEKLINELEIAKEAIIHKGYITMLLIKNNSPYSKYIKN